MHGDGLPFISYFFNFGIEDCMSIPILSNFGKLWKEWEYFFVISDMEHIVKGSVFFKNIYLW